MRKLFAIIILLLSLPMLTAFFRKYSLETLCIALILVTVCTSQHSDFMVYHKAVRDLMHGGWEAVFRPDDMTPFKYHPFAVFLMLPFGLPSLPVASVIWAFANGFFLYDTLVRLRRHWAADNRAVLLAVVCVVQAITWQIKFENVTFAMLWLFTLAATSQSAWKEGLFVAILILLKPFWIVLMPIFVLSNNWKGMAWCVGFVALGSLSVFVTGFESGKIAYMLCWKTLTDATNAHNYPKNDNQCLYAILYRHAADLGRYSTLIWVSVSALYGLFWLWATRWIKDEHEKLEAYLFIVPVILFAGPLSWIHHQILLIPVFALLIHRKQYRAAGIAFVIFNLTGEFPAGRAAFVWMYQLGIPVFGFFVLSWGLLRKRD